MAITFSDNRLPRRQPAPSQEQAAPQAVRLAWNRAARHGARTAITPSRTTPTYKSKNIYCEGAGENTDCSDFATQMKRGLLKMDHCVVEHRKDKPFLLLMHVLYRHGQ